MHMTCSYMRHQQAQDRLLNHNYLRNKKAAFHGRDMACKIEKCHLHNVLKECKEVVSHH